MMIETTLNIQTSLSVYYTYAGRIEFTLYKPVKYEDIVSIPDAFTPAQTFLSDYHAVRFLSSITTVPNLNVQEVLIALSNLLRRANKNGIQEVHLVSLRLRKHGKYWIITDY